MALVSCPECETQVSSKASGCPQCGYPIAGNQPKRAVMQKGMRRAVSRHTQRKTQGPVRVQTVELTSKTLKAHALFAWICGALFFLLVLAGA